VRRLYKSFGVKGLNEALFVISLKSCSVSICTISTRCGGTVECALETNLNVRNPAPLFSSREICAARTPAPAPVYVYVCLFVCFLACLQEKRHVIDL
jgi:hypothetical protein